MHFFLKAIELVRIGQWCGGLVTLFTHEVGLLLFARLKEEKTVSLLQFAEIKNEYSY